MDKTLIRGDVNELQCILDFQSRGYYCSIPFSGSCRYDVVVDINGKLLRIQCKSSSFHEEDGTLRMDATRTTTNTKKTISYSYSKEEIDYFYTSWNGYGFLLPVEEVGTTKYLRVKPPKQGIQATMCIANDYLLDNVIESITTNTPLKKYWDTRYISIDENGNEKIWSYTDLQNNFSDRQIRYIREKSNTMEPIKGILWKIKEFPTL